MEGVVEVEVGGEDSNKLPRVDLREEAIIEAAEAASFAFCFSCERCWRGFDGRDGEGNGEKKGAARAGLYNVVWRDKRVETDRCNAATL